MTTDRTQWAMSFIVSCLVIIGLIAWGCDKNLAERSEAEQPTKHSIRLLARADLASIELWEVDGCQYVVTSNGGIAHKENCPNHGAVR
jgi:hypothetical protein